MIEISIFRVLLLLVDGCWVCLFCCASLLRLSLFPVRLAGLDGCLRTDAHVLIEPRRQALTRISPTRVESD